MFHYPHATCSSHVPRANTASAWRFRRVSCCYGVAHGTNSRAPLAVTVCGSTTYCGHLPQPIPRLRSTQEC